MGDEGATDIPKSGKNERRQMTKQVVPSNENGLNSSQRAIFCVCLAVTTKFL